MSVGTSLIRLGHPQVSNFSNANAMESDIHQPLTNLRAAPIRGAAQSVIDNAQQFEGIIPGVSDKVASVSGAANRPIKSAQATWDHFTHVTLPVGGPADELIPWNHS
jgi:hypothetical protein